MSILICKRAHQRCIRQHASTTKAGQSSNGMRQKRLRAMRHSRVTQPGRTWKNSLSSVMPSHRMGTITYLVALSFCRHCIRVSAFPTTAVFTCSGLEKTDGRCANVERACSARMEVQYHAHGRQDSAHLKPSQLALLRCEIYPETLRILFHIRHRSLREV